MQRFLAVKKKKKQQLAAFIQQKEGISIDPTTIFDIQIKRLHEYKRQLLNAFSILYLYYGIKDGSITNFTPTTFLFGAKAAPGYRRAKAIILFINEIAKMIAADDEVNQLIKVVFVSNYNVSYAEKLVAAADVSEQISTAGTEASGTGNMKLMLNGAVTLGTYDGANVEIVEEAGEENNYIFGAKVEELETILPQYDSRKLFVENKRIRRVVEALIDEPFPMAAAENSGNCIMPCWMVQAGMHRITTTCWGIWNPTWKPSCAATRIIPIRWHLPRSSGSIFAMPVSLVLIVPLQIMQKIFGALTRLNSNRWQA